VDYNNFFSKHKSLIDSISFDGDKKNDYLYQMRYSKFKKKSIFIRLIIFVLIFSSAYILYKNFDKLKEILTVETVKTITEIPKTGLDLFGIPGIIGYEFNFDDKDLMDEMLGFCEDRWAVELVIIINKRNWITVFKNGKKIIGREYNTGDVIKLKGYSFYLHTQYSSAIDVLLNGKAIKYFNGKSGYQKLLITNSFSE
jgi:hypothetical protein